MKHFDYPLNLTFKIGTLSNDFTAKDANGSTIAYVRQKMFKLKEEVLVYEDETKNTVNYRINADKWLDFNTTYKFTGYDGEDLGRIARKGWKSLWKAHYEIFDENGQQDLLIQEENPIAKVFDSLLGEIPILGFFTGYFFNPKYILKRPDGTLVARLSKLKSLVGRRFMIDKLSEFEEGEEDRILLGIMMMVLLERRRG
jgi:hypothetical protein